MATLTDNILALSYLLIWVATLIWYQNKHRQIDGGSTVIISYILYAVFSIVTLNDEFFDITYEHLQLFPFIYLYIMLMLALSPAISIHFKDIRNIENPHSRTLMIPCILAIICIFVQIPTLLSNFNSNFLSLFLDSDAGKDAYMEGLENASDSGSAIRNLPAIIYNMLYDCVVFLFFYFLTLKNKKPLFLITLFIAIFIGMIIPVMNGQRGSVIKAGLTIVAGYMLFRQFISSRVNRIIQMAGIVVAVLVALPIIAITISRFSDRKNDTGAGGFVYWYVGQANIYFNNYALDAGGTRNGDRTMNLFKRVVSSDTPKNYVERRDKYANLNIDDYWFTTFVGDFVIDFGPLVAFLIFLVFNGWVYLHIRPRDGTIKLYELLLVYFSLCVCLQGGMTLFMYSDTSNLAIIVMALLYAWLRYHEALLKRFPLTKTEIA